VIEQRLGFLTPEQFRGMRQDHVVQVGGDHGAGIDHGVAEDMGLFAQCGVDPYRRQAEGRILGRGADQLSGHPPRIDRQVHPGEGLAVADRDTLQGQAIGIGAQFEVVADMHRRREEADLLGEFLAQAANALEQFPALAAIDQRDQPIADFKPEHVDRCDIGPAGFDVFRHGRGLLFGARRLRPRRPARIA
jgi:hypothetical protein